MTPLKANGGWYIVQYIIRLRPFSYRFAPPNVPREFVSTHNFDSALAVGAGNWIQDENGNWTLNKSEVCRKKLDVAARGQTLGEPTPPVDIQVLFALRTTPFESIAMGKSHYISSTESIGESCRAAPFDNDRAAN